MTYTHPLAAIWSGTPLGIPLHPVQAYAALAFLTLAIFLLVWQPAIRQAGDLAGMGLMGAGVAIFITELWRDTEGRGAMLDGALDGPQVAAIVLVVAGALVLLERKDRRTRDEAVPWLRGRSRAFQRRTIEVPAEAAGQRLDQFLPRNWRA